MSANWKRWSLLRENVKSFVDFKFGFASNIDFKNLVWQYSKIKIFLKSCLRYNILHHSKLWHKSEDLKKKLSHRYNRGMNNYYEPQDWDS